MQLADLLPPTARHASLGVLPDFPDAFVPSAREALSRAVTGPLGIFPAAQAIHLIAVLDGSAPVAEIRARLQSADATMEALTAQHPRLAEWCATLPAPLFTLVREAASGMLRAAPVVRPPDGTRYMPTRNAHLLPA